MRHASVPPAPLASREDPAVRPVASALALWLTGLAIMGCGDDGSSAEEARLGSQRDGAGAPETLVAALGDSITAGAPAWDPDPGAREPIGEGADPASQYEYWAELRLRNTSFRNCGVSGERTDEMARRLARCAKGADVLLVQGGINDIAQGRDVADAAADLRRMVRRGKALGLRVGLAEVLPWNNGHPAAAAAIRELNGRIRRIGREEGAGVLPWYRLLEDPEAPGRMKREWTADGDHPSVEGYRRLGETVDLP